jgi:hypothetical protein
MAAETRERLMERTRSAGTRRSGGCRCRAVRLETRGEPVRISVCHCLDCQRRSGSAFAAQARFPDADVTITGETRIWSRTGDAGGRIDDRFCPACGSSVAYAIDSMPGVTAIPLGAFDDPHGVPAPTVSVYEERKHPWLAILGEGVAHEW